MIIRSEITDYLCGEIFVRGRLNKNGPTYWNSSDLNAINAHGSTVLTGDYRIPYADYLSMKIKGYFWFSTESTFV